MRRLSNDRGKGSRVFPWRRIAERFCGAGRSSSRSRRLFFETLDARNLLAASVVDLELVDDTGAYADDLVTREAAVTGLVVNMDGNTVEAEVQFDHNGDGVPEGGADIDSSNDFLYDAVEEDVALNNWSGVLTLRYRVVETLEYDEDEEGPDEIIGDWDSYTFVLDRVPPHVIGTSREDGQVTNDSLDNFLVTFDEDIDLNALAQATIRVNEAPSGLLPAQTAAAVSSDAVQITFDDGLLPAGEYKTSIHDVVDVAGNDIEFVSVLWRINAAPEIADFAAIQGTTFWSFSGRVLDEDAIGLNVTFGQDLDGYTTKVTETDGTFDLIVELPEDHGVVTLYVTDAEGLVSQPIIYLF